MPVPPTPPSSLHNSALAAAVAFAVAAPVLVPFDLPPSATVLNQAVAWVGWGIVGVLMAQRASRRGALPAGVMAYGTALLLVAIGAALATAFLSLPPGMALSIAASVVAAGSLMLVASCSDGIAGDAVEPGAQSAMQALCIALLLTGLASSLLAALQIFAPGWLEGSWMAGSTGGRAAGNLRQPNHLATLLLWSCAAVVWAVQTYRRAAVVRWSGIALMLAFVLGLVLTASRTGALGVLAMASWGALDRRLARLPRLLLVLMPVAWVAMWFAVTTPEAGLGPVGFIGMDRLRQDDPTSSRFAIWRNALELIRLYPAMGVGVGNFNFAWTLTPFPGRPIEFFDHAHNLFVHLVAEMGLPLGGATALLLLAGFYFNLMSAVRATPERAPTRSALFMMLLVMGIHSLFEYPLWYAYFLFPTAFIAGLQLGTSGASPVRDAAPRTRVLSWACAAVAAGGLLILWDYRGVSTIFVANEGGAPLERRIAAGQRSLLFGHHADYARVTAMQHSPLDQFERPVHYLLDVRLMSAWAQALADAGLQDHARYVAQRLREFAREDAQAFFRLCGEIPANDPSPFQCESPQRTLSPADFR